LLDKRRKLQDQAEEEAARIVVARAEETRTSAIYQAAARAADVAQLLANATANASKAAALEAEIDRTFGELCALLQERSDLDDGLAATMKVIALQDAAASATGDALIGGVPGGRFDWRRIPSANNPHGRYSLPGGA
jgi:predicted component of type VI protein secretion system